MTFFLQNQPIMKHAFAIMLTMCAAMAVASAQDKPDNERNDTLFRICYDSNCFYIMNSDVVAFEHVCPDNEKYYINFGTFPEQDIYRLTTEKAMQLGEIKVTIGHSVRLFEKTKSGVWEPIHVQHPWSSFFPSGPMRMLYLLIDEEDFENGSHFHRIVHNINFILIYI